MFESEKNRDVEENEYLDSESNDGFDFEEFNKEKDSEEENVVLHLTLDKKNKKFKIEENKKTQKIVKFLENNKNEEKEKNENLFKNNINFPTKNNPKKIKKKNLYLFQHLKNENTHDKLFKEKIEENKQKLNILKNKNEKNDVNEDNKILRFKLKEINDINKILKNDLEKLNLKFSEFSKLKNNKNSDREQKREFLELEEKYLNLKKDFLEIKKKEKFQMEKKNQGFVKDLEEIQNQYENAFSEIKKNLEKEKSDLILQNKKLLEKNNNFIKENEILNKKVINLQIEKKNFLKDEIFQIKTNYENIIKALEEKLQNSEKKNLEEENLGEKNYKLEIQLNNQNLINQELKQNLDDLENELEKMISNDTKMAEILDKNQNLFKQQKSIFNEIFKISLKTNRLKNFLEKDKKKNDNNKIFKGSNSKKEKNLYNSILNQFRSVFENIENFDFVIKNLKEENFEIKKDIKEKNEIINKSEENIKIFENEFENINEENKILKENLNELTDQLNEQIEQMEEFEEKENIRLENVEKYNKKDKINEKEKIKNLEKKIKEFENLEKKNNLLIYKLKKFVYDDTVFFLIENFVQIEIDIKILEEKQINLQIKFTDEIFQNENIKNFENDFEKNFSGTHLTEENNNITNLDYNKKIEEVENLIKLKEQKKMNLESKILKFEQEQKNKIKNFVKLEKELEKKKKYIKKLQNENEKNLNLSFTSEKFKITGRPKSSYKKRSVKNYSVYNKEKKWISTKFGSQKFTPLKNSGVIEYNVLKGKLEKLRDKYNNI